MVCFTIEEAHVLDDTLWFAHGIRREFAVMVARAENREAAKVSAEADLAKCRTGLDSSRTHLAASLQYGERQHADLLQCQVGKKRQFWLGFGLGGALLSVIGYGVGRAVR